MISTSPRSHAAGHCTLIAMDALSPSDSTRRLQWAHGVAEVQALGAMLAPVRFRAEGHPEFSPLQVAPWADEPGGEAWPGILRRLRGEWPCVPFGRTDRPALPAGWTPRDPDGNDAGHGHGSNEAWSWLPSEDPLSLRLALEYPVASPVRRLVRRVRAVPDAAALAIELEVHVRRPCRLPVALHPVLRLDAGPVRLRIPHAGGRTYPVPAEQGLSRVRADAPFDRFDAVPLAAGGHVDLSRYPLPFDTEELVQLLAVRGPLVAGYEALGWSLELDWDHAALPDLMLWVSHRGRRHAPWNGRHWALGVEPLDGAFDLGRVAEPPADHPLAGRGIALAPGQPWRLAYGLRAVPHG